MKEIKYKECGSVKIVVRKCGRAKFKGGDSNMEIR